MRWRNEAVNPHKVCLRKIQCPAPGRAQVTATIGCQLKLAALQREERRGQKERYLSPSGQAGYRSGVRVCND